MYSQADFHTEPFEEDILVAEMDKPVAVDCSLAVAGGNQELVLVRDEVVSQPYFFFVLRYPIVSAMSLGPVVQKPINANPRLKVNQRVYFYTLKCCSTLIFGKTLH